MTTTGVSTSSTAHVGRNWAGNHVYTAQALHRPAGLDELRELVAGSTRLRVLGSRHSFNDLADSPGDLVSLAGLPTPLEVDAGARRALVPAAMTYAQLAPALHARGLALPAMASLPHITVAGAVSTSTHGSGDASGSLATAVAGLDLVRSDGRLVHLSREEDAAELAGSVVGLGALGVVTALTLDLVPTYDVRQDVYEQLPWAALDDHLDDITSRVLSTSFFTRWGGDAVAQVWRKSLVPPGGAGSAPRELFGARPAPVERHPLPGQSAHTCTPQLGVPGPWFERLPHFRPRHRPSAGEEVQAEYLLERSALPAAVAALRSLAARLDPLLLMSELRTVAADDLWLSPASARDVVAVHFTFRREPAAVLRLLAAVEGALVPLGARPHWAKLFTLDAGALAGLYPRWSDFRALVARRDPRGLFANDFLHRVGLTA